MDHTSFLARLRILLLGTAAGAAACTLLLVIFAAACVGLRRIPQAALVPLTIAAAAVGAFLAGWVSGALSGRHGLIYGLCSALLLFLILFICGEILTRDGLSAAVYIRFGVMLLLGMLGGIAGVNRRLRY